MPHATVISQNNSIHKAGTLFMRGVKTPITLDQAGVLRKDTRFHVEFDDPIEERKVIEDDEAEETKVLSPKQRLQEIADAIDSLDPDDEDAFTNAGLPDARKLSSILGYQVTAKDRDDAMAMAQNASAKALAEVEGAGQTARRAGNLVIKRPAAQQPAAPQADTSTEGAVEA